MFPLLFSDITQGEYYLLAATVLFLWLLPIVTIVVTIIAFAVRERLLKMAVYILSLPTLVTGIVVISQGNAVSVLKGTSSFLLFVAPMVIVCICCVATWLRQVRVQQ